MPPEFPSISELTESYETADRFTREVAQFRSAVAVPANNELRYAGHHLLQALDGQEQISKPDEVRKAKNHCERAMYDADDLNAMIDEDRTKEQRESRRFLLQFVVRVAGSLLAAMGLIWTIWYTLTSGDAAPGS